MKSLIGVLLVILGVVTGLYVGLYECLFMGIVDMFNGITGDPASGVTFAWGFIKFWFSAVAGWFCFVVIAGFGAALIND